MDPIRIDVNINENSRPQGLTSPGTFLAGPGGPRTPPLITVPRGSYPGITHEGAEMGDSYDPSMPPAIRRKITSAVEKAQRKIDAGLIQRDKDYESLRSMAHKEEQRAERERIKGANRQDTNERFVAGEAFKNREMSANDPANQTWFDRFVRRSFQGELDQINEERGPGNEMRPYEEAAFFRKKRANVAQSWMFPAGMQFGGMIGGQAGSMLGGSMGFRMAEAFPQAAPYAVGGIAALGLGVAAMQRAGQEITQLAPYSGTLASRMSLEKQYDIASYVSRGKEYGGVLSAYGSVAGDLTRAFSEVVDELLTLLLPILYPIAYGITGILEVVSFILSILTGPIKAVADHFNPGKSTIERLFKTVIPPDAQADPEGFLAAVVKGRKAENAKLQRWWKFVPNDDVADARRLLLGGR